MSGNTTELNRGLENGNLADAGGAGSKASGLDSRNRKKKGPKSNKTTAAKPPKRDIFNDNISDLEQQLRNGKRVNGSSKKNQISINHLLDFLSYRDLEEYHMNRSRKHTKKERRPSRLHQSLRGMAFVNVNYKFVVDCNGNYASQQIDPNIPFALEDIFQIIAHRGNQCPICLTDELVAPRMLTACGHILCLRCLLRLLESELPQAQKRQGAAVVEKYRECPLCSSIIRKKEVKPVRISSVDERFEIPQVNQETVLTLMYRPHASLVALPVSMEELRPLVEPFPWVNSDHEFDSYLRVFRGGSEYLEEMFAAERAQITALQEEERTAYGEDIFTQRALDDIDAQLEAWKTFRKDKAPVAPEKKTIEVDPEPFRYYQTGFHSNTIYVLSPLDMKVLRTSYGNYSAMPTSIVAPIETIRYDELSPETALTKFKYLSHLPIGTTIGFMECNWRGSPYVNSEAWTMFKNDLTKRSQSTARKLRKEEQDRIRALDEEEIRTRAFYERENGTNSDEMVSQFKALDVAYTDLPVLTSESMGDSEESDSEYRSTPWGTKIRKSELEAAMEEHESWEANEMIRRAREDMNKENGKKKKKKRILLSSNAW